MCKSACLKILKAQYKISIERVNNVATLLISHFTNPEVKKPQKLNLKVLSRFLEKDKYNIKLPDE